MHREIIKANIVVFIASFCTLVIELIAGRIMAPYIGVSFTPGQASSESS